MVQFQFSGATAYSSKDDHAGEIENKVFEPIESDSLFDLIIFHGPGNLT